MIRHFMLFALIVLSACHKGTYVRVTVDSGSPMNPTEIDVKITNAGKSAMAQYDKAGIAFPLPQSFVFIVEDGRQGAVTLEIIARDAAHAELARGKMATEIIQGSTDEVLIVLNPVAPILDAGIPDGYSGPIDGSYPDLDAAVPPDMTRVLVWTPQLSGTMNDLNAIAGNASGDLYAVGAKGTILHSFDHGKTWTPLNSHTSQTLYGVWTQTFGRGFVVGAGGTILDVDFVIGSLNSGVSEALDAIWATGPNDIYVGGERGRILHSTNGGMKWDVQPSGTSNTITGIWGTDSGNIYAVGQNGTILHSDGNGAAWMPLKSGVVDGLFAVWGSSTDDVYAVGQAGLILHSSNHGLKWDARWAGARLDYPGIWGSAIDDVYIIAADSEIFHSANFGMNWMTETMPANAALRGIWGTGPGDVYAVGIGGVILHGQ